MKRRVLSWLLVLAVCLSLVPASVVSAAQPKTETAPAEKAASVQTAPASTQPAQSRKGILPGAGGDAIGFNVEAKTYDTLYFGTYHEDENDKNGEPYPWRILDGNTSRGGSGMFLLSEKYFGVYYCYAPDVEDVKAIKHNDWQDQYCYARKWCEAFATKTDWFTDDEKALMLPTSKTYGNYHSTDKWFYTIDDHYGLKVITDCTLSNEKVFFLSASEYENPSYGLTVTDSKLDYVLRSLVSGKHTMDDQSTYDSFVAVAVPGSGLQRWPSYWKQYVGQKMIYEDTWVDRIFGMREYFPFLTEEVYTYIYRKFNARPAMNLNGSKIVYTVAADNSSHADYGVPTDYSGNEWKLVLSDGTTAFKEGTSLAVEDTTKPPKFGTDGGTLTVNHPAIGEGYDAVTAALLDPQGNILCYGTINSDKTATTSTVTIPSDLPDGVYTLRVTAEKWNEVKKEDYAAVPFEAKVTVANEHYHKLCWDRNCPDGCEEKAWLPVANAEELAKMEPDGYYFLIDDVTVDEKTLYRGHLCLSSHKLAGTLHAGDGFTLCVCEDNRSNVPTDKIVVVDGAEVTLYGFMMEAEDAIEVGENAVLNIRTGKNTYNPNMSLASIGANSVVNQYGASLDGTAYEHDGRVPELVIPDTVTVNIYGGRLGYSTLRTGGTLNIRGGSVGIIRSGQKGSVVNFYGGSIDGIGSDYDPFAGDLNLYAGFRHLGDCIITKPINICDELTFTPSTPRRVDLEDADNKVIAGQITNGWSKYMSGKNFNDYVVRDSSGFRNYLGDDGEIYTRPVTHETGSHPICGAECTHNGAHPALEWTAVTTWDEFLSLVQKDGTQNICLNSDIKNNYATERISVKGTINLCLHGYKIDLVRVIGGTGGHFVVENGAALNITDCAGGGVITNGRTEKTDDIKQYAVGGAIRLKEGATATLYGGTISESVADLGGAVYVAQGATFTMEGGTLDGNYAKGEGWNDTKKRNSKGGAVYLAGGTFILNGGLLKNNNTVTMQDGSSASIQDGGGAVYIADGGRFEMNGGTLRGNYAGRLTVGYSSDFNGNAVRVNSGTFEMNGGTIANNDGSSLSHNAIYVDGDGTFTMKDGTIENSAATAVRLAANKATFNMSGGTIIGGTSSNFDSTGVIHMTGGTFNMKDGKITDCATGVYMDKGGRFTMDNGEITNCVYGVRALGDSTASTSTAVFTMNGGKIGDTGSNRTYDGYAVGVYTNATFNLKGGEISGYKSNSTAVTGGVDVWENAILNISGAPKVYNNDTAFRHDFSPFNIKTIHLLFPVASNINLHLGAKLDITSVYLSEGAKLGLTIRSLPRDNTYEFYPDLSGSVFNEKFKIVSLNSKYFFSDNTAFTLGSTSNGYLTLKGIPVAQDSTTFKVTTAEGTKTIDAYGNPITLSPNETATLTPVINPDNATDKSYEWGVYDPNGTIKLSGNKVTALKETGDGEKAYIVFAPKASDLKNANLHYLEITVAAKEYTVKFVMNGHGEQIKAMTVAAGTKLTLDEPTAPGYTFLGWYTDAALTQPWDMDSAVKSNMTLYAKWVPGQYSVGLDANGGACSEVRIIVRYGEAYGELPTPTRANYKFLGWFTAAEGGERVTEKTTLDTVPTAEKPVKIYAHWQQTDYTVTLDANGGTAPVDHLTIPVGGTYADLPYDGVTRTGYTFDGWYTELGTEVMMVDDVRPENHTLYAHWKANSYTVSFDTDGGSTIGDRTVTYDAPYNELPTPTRAGYDFAGWFTKGGEQVTEETTVKTDGDHTLFAHWTAKGYEVTLDTNGGDPMEALHVTFGGTYEGLTAATRTGYSFLGWFTEDGKTEVKVEDTVTTAGDHTLYAHWEANIYNVFLDANGGRGGGTITVTYDGKYTGLIKPYRTGYSFLGWFTEKDGGTQIAADDTVKTADNHILYAHWKAEEYEVTLDANGGEGGKTITVTYDGQYTGLTDATRTGYTFLGWFTEKDGGDRIETTTTVKTEGKHTLYAHWQANTYTVTLDANGGEAMEAITVTYDGKYTVLTDAMRAGYDFAGWFTAKEGGTEVKATDTVTTASDHTLYAHWTVLPADRPTVTVCDDLALTYGYADGSIYVTVPALENYTLAYQWYRCGKTGENAEEIAAAKADRYALPLGMAAGTTYYRCDVTATRKDNGQTATVASNVITVTVNRAKLDAALSMADYTYGETVSTPALEGNAENGNVTYYYQAAAERKLWTDITPTTLSAGEYTLFAAIDGTANYEGCEVTARFTVRKATPVVTEWPPLGELYVNDTLKADWHGTASVEGSFTVTGGRTWAEAGTQTTELTFTPKDTVNYEILTHEASVAVNKRTVQAVTTVLAPVNDRDYGTELAALGLPATVEIMTTDGKRFADVPVAWNGYDATLLTEQMLTGTLDLTAIAKEVMQPEAAVAAKVTVTLRELTPENVEFKDKIAVYTGEPIPHTLPEGIAGVASVRYEYAGADYAASETAPTDVGTYTVTATFTMQPGYTQLAPMAATLTINKAEGSLTAPTSAELTYNGESQTLVNAGETATGTLEYKLDGGEYSTEIPEATAAGSYVVFYRVVGDKNHEDVAEQSLTVTIAPKPVEIPKADETGFTYNGAEQTYAVAANDDYTVTGSAQANAGTYTVTVALNDKDNTAWAGGTDTTDLSYTFTIRPAGVTVTAADKLIYVGEAAPDLSAPESGKDYTVTGLIGEDALTTAPTLRYEPAEPDTSTVGEALICAENADAGSNYVISYVNGKLTVTDRPLYAITLAETANGILAASATSAIEGTVVTVIALADEGYRLVSVEAVDASGSALPLTDIGNGTYTFTMPAGAVTLRAAFEKTVPDNFFCDVLQSDYYYEAVRWAVLAEVTNGMTPELFVPNGRCTRAQLVTFLWRAAGKPEPTALTSFADVPADAYYAKAVAWAMEQGITIGTSETTFSPNDFCTRAQCITFLCRQAKGVAAESEMPFSDVPADAYYADAVKWAADSGVALGTGHGKYSPELPCTRAESVTFLWRLYTLN